MWERGEHMGCHDPTQAEPLPAMWVVHLLHQFSKSSCFPAKEISFLVWGRAFIIFRCSTVLTNPLWNCPVQLVNIIPHDMLILSVASWYLIPEAHDSYNRDFMRSIDLRGLHEPSDFLGLLYTTTKGSCWLLWSSVFLSEVHYLSSWLRNDGNLQIRGGGETDVSFEYTHSPEQWISFSLA